MDPSSEKKLRKQPKDYDTKKRSSVSSHRHDFPQGENRASMASPSSQPNFSSVTEGGMQRKHHWETILDSSHLPSAHLDRTRTSHFKHPSQDTKLSSKSRNASSSHTKHRQQPVRPPLRAVRIAPSGPIVEPREENDGYRFKCPEEGCEQRFRHRSSRSRHKKNCHMRNNHSNT